MKHRHKRDTNTSIFINYLKNDIIRYNYKCKYGVGVGVPEHTFN